MSLKNKIESLLFVATKPLAPKKLIELTGGTEEEIRNALAEIREQYNTQAQGIQLVSHNGKVQLMTNPENRKIVEAYLKEEQFSELTKPGLETLTIIAYRGPVTKPELEQIRGVNCSLILRNLMIKGLVEAQDDQEKMQTNYTVTFDFIRYLGLREISELPEYEKLSRHENIEKILALTNQPSEE